MGKHDKTKREKSARNEAYAKIYRQRECRTCGHRTSVKSRCVMCGGTMWRTRR